MTQVVAALIWDQDRFLACQRPAHKARGLLWEFVGGKVEENESREDALRRECREELGIDLYIHNVYYEVDHIYPDIAIHLTLFNASIRQGTPQLLEHNAIKWLLPDEILDYEFCPADREILDKIIFDAGKMESLRLALRDASDPQYKKFHCALMPTVDPDTVLGVRMPQLRKIFSQCNDISDSFLSHLPHRYYEENNLHGLLISKIKDFNEAVEALEAFLPFVNNWATCDLIAPKAFQADPAKAGEHALVWMCNHHAYTVRFGIGILLRYCLDAHFKADYAEAVASVSHEDYYVKMMIAWYFATALAKQYASVIPYLEKSVLPKWIHNKTIQKAIESYRIPDERKAYLRTLRMK